MDLSSARTSNGFGMNPISYSEMKNYFELNQIEVHPWEVELIKMFDSAAMQVISDHQEKQRQSQQKKK